VPVRVVDVGHTRVGVPQRFVPMRVAVLAGRLNESAA
jgi:hypothetical protein